jgi:hypothetical protein
MGDDQPPPNPGPSFRARQEVKLQVSSLSDGTGPGIPDWEFPIRGSPVNLEFTLSVAHPVYATQYTVRFASSDT